MELHKKLLIYPIALASLSLSSIEVNAGVGYIPPNKNSYPSRSHHRDCRHYKETRAHSFGNNKNINQIDYLEKRNDCLEKKIANEKQEGKEQYYNKSHDYQCSRNKPENKEGNFPLVLTLSILGWGAFGAIFYATRYCWKSLNSKGGEIC
ncbi:MAG: hypothetical protein AABY06_03665 [Nanoarchaeota archaeon]